MDFTPTPQVESLLERIREFNEEHVYPVEMEMLRNPGQRVGLPGAVGKVEHVQICMVAGEKHPSIVVLLEHRPKENGHRKKRQN